MADFLQTVIATISVGSLYALIALGYTMVYGVLKFINFAHSDIFVLGAWTSFSIASVLLMVLGVSAEHAPWWVAVVCIIGSMAVCILTALAAERFAYRPLRRAPRLNVLITAIGVSLFLQNLGQLQLKTPLVLARDAEGKPVATYPFGATPKSMPLLLPDAVLNEAQIAQGKLADVPRRGFVTFDSDITLQRDRSYRIQVLRGTGDEQRDENLTLIIRDDTNILPDGRAPAGTAFETQPRRNAEQLAGATYRLYRSPTVPIRLVDVLISASALVLMLGLQGLVFGTKMGSAMRAVSYNIETAYLMGINVNRVIAFTFAVGASLAAAAAFLYAMKYPGLNQPAHGIWVLLGLKAFVAAVVGGIGDVRGAVLGGFLIAAIEFFGSLYIEPALADVYVFGVLIVVLLVRPNGILGLPLREKV